MQRNTIVTSLFALTLAASLSACAPVDIGGAPQEGEVVVASTIHEVYFQDPNGTQVTLGYYNTETRLLEQAPLLDDEYSGFLFQTPQENIMIEGALGGTYEAELTLELGAVYDAYVWLASAVDVEPVALGTIVVDLQPVEIDGIDAIYGGSFCSTSTEFCKIGFTGYFRCKNTVCRGSSQTQSCRRVLVWQC